ncbi:MAG: hypothetical protein EOQ30_03335 [Mesorhizobium sp.]|nr:MAG: hypothetical protein EOQ29_04970 [Mesorhizobium sp.]RWA86355.1 MAG: hypothetical protein EOQ30_03335 [Mesorhizobium sp.]RWB20117.1 MAG: hypothetical protein EOQ40_17065 [Mesorhizobium sp.]TIS52419.1 MAG: hypothetical protein E5W96_00275 [Mesorhizobium sp.]
MWEALMMLRLIASVAPSLPIGQHDPQPILPIAKIKGAIRLSFAGYRLSLPIPSENVQNHDQKIA